MTSRRSYLDTLNSGRQRRSTSSLDDLARTLEALETQLERPSPFADSRRRDAESRSSHQPHSYAQTEHAASVARAQALQAVAHDFERTRREGDGVAAVGQIALELQALREDMRQQMAAALSSEFDALRGDVHRIASEADRVGRSDALLQEVERLSSAISDLSQRSDDQNVSLLRRELDQVKAAVSPLAREETLRAVGHRWDEFDDRMARFEERVAANQPGARDDATLDALTRRLEQIAAAVEVLPESLSLRTLEDKVRTLAGALDHFARKQDAQSEQTFDMIAERLDEISRAIAASVSRNQVAAVDPAPFQRIEARMASLASQIEELTEDRPSTEVLGQLTALSSRVDELAARAALPEKAVERLGAQLGLIVERLEKEPPSPDLTAIFDGLEQRFAVLSDALDQRQGESMEQGNKLLRDLESRLDAIVERLDIHAEERPDSKEILSVMDERFADLAARFDERVANGPEAASIRELETRLGDIATRLDNSAQQAPGLDETIINRLEAQVAELSTRLSNPARLLPELDNLAPRFDQIERSIAGQHDQLIEAARNAAAEAVRDLADRSGDPEAIASLSGELRSLEVLTRKSDERNSKTFEAIHDTLIKIVDRLSAMEQGEHDAGTGKPMVADAPSIAADDAFEPTPLGAFGAAEPRHDEPEAEAAGSDASNKDALDDEASLNELPLGEMPLELGDLSDKDAIPGDKRSVLGGLSKALRGRKDTRAASKDENLPEAFVAPEEQVVPQLDQPLGEALDPRIANQPLEPGSGAPDLHAIMRRVRDERAPAGRKDDTDTAKSDFIAAARRAAQAAAAEAVIKKRGGDSEDGSGRSKFGRMLGLRRKTVLMATVAMAVGVGGLQLGRAFLFDNAPQVADVDPTEPEKAPATLIAAAPPAISAADPSAAQMQLEPEEVEPSGDAALLEAPGAPLPTPPAVEAAANDAQGSVSLEPTAAEIDQPAAPASLNRAPAALQAAAPVVTEVAEVTEAAKAAEAAPVQTAAPAASIPATEALAVANEETVQTASLATPFTPLGMEEPIVPGLQPTLAGAGELKAATPEVGGIPVTAGPIPLREAAEAGDAKALFEIGTRYAEGRNGVVDLKTAAEWYQKAADRGYAPAQYRLGNFYEKGMGVDRDYARAKALYEKSAAQGNASAMHNLAVLYAMGADGMTDNKTAVRWFTEAAERGVKDSQFNLGILAAKGVGMNQDLGASYKWFSLVAKEGDKDAEAKRDEIAATLQPDELDRARADTRLWRAKIADPAANEVDVPAEWRESRDLTASIDMKQAVKNIQLILNKNGFDAGRPDGIMGGKTKAAIIAFQSANGLTADGEVNEPLVQALLQRK